MTMGTMDELSEEQKQYLAGLIAGQAAARVAAAVARPAAPAQPAPSGPDALAFEAQNRTVAAGGKLTDIEQAKRKKNALDLWDELVAHAREGRFPKGTDGFLWKYHGLFHVAPAQNAFMCRLRIPNGILSAHQLAAVADLAEAFAAGHADITTRANLQVREIRPEHAVDVLMALSACGLTSRGAGADNIRNITGNPTAGIDPQELYDTRPLGLALHHHILNHRELYGLPRKFNIAFDGGGSVAALQDTNDIGFTAVRVPEGAAVASGVWFRLALGGITGHKDFARDLGVVVAPQDCVAVARALVRVFIEHGDRTDRNKARMKYVLDRIGHAKYLELAEGFLGRTLDRLPIEACEPRAPQDRTAHIGFHPQKQAGKLWCGVYVPAARMTAAQMRGLAALAVRYGSGTIRLTVWQNLLVSDIAEADREAVAAALADLGLSANVSPIRAGLVACTGNAGCKFAASDTKRHSLAIAAHVERRVALDQPVNVHLTGCHHSCAQHYIGDIGLIAAKVGDEQVEGYHVHVGGGWGEDAAIAREVVRDVKAEDAPRIVANLLDGYLEERKDPHEPFHAFARRHSPEQLADMAQGKVAA
jgi:ferredoxin-nitrite reductase